MKRRKISVFSSRELRWGDDIVKTTDAAIAKCKYGIVIVSSDLLAGEENAVVSSLTRKAKDKSFTLLPLRMKGVTEEELERLPLLSNHKSVRVVDEKDDNMEDIASELEKMISQGK